MLLKTNLLLSTGFAVAMIAQPAVALAQEQVAPPADADPQAESSAPTAAAASTEAEGIGDIVVTARRVEENLQTTPVAVTAIGERALVEAQVEDVSDLQRTAPGLVISKGTAGTSGFALVSIRGQGNLQPILANDPAVATYIDGVYIARPSTGLTDLQDIQRVEVLRGPQGTLFGRNTTGGAVNIISNDPTDQFEGEVKAELGNYDYRGLSATLNVPLGDNLAARATYSYRERDGFGESIPLNRDIGNIDSHFVRGKIKYDGEGFDITLSGDYNRQKDTGQNIQLAAVNGNLPTFAAFPPAFLAGLRSGIVTRQTFRDNFATGTRPAAGTAVLPADVQALYDDPPFNELEVYGFAALINVELGDFNLKSISAYRHNENQGLNDTDAAPVPLLATFSGSNSRYYSQEFQISGDITDALSFIAGGYYGNEKGTEYSRSQLFGGRLRDSTADLTNKTVGLFAQAYYDISDTVRAVGGFRYTWDSRDSFLHNAQVLGLPFNAPVPGTPTGINCTVTMPDTPPTATECTQTQKADFSYPAWTAGIDWQASDEVFVYAKTSGAAKAGGWNLRAGGLPSFRPEKVKDVELGLKADLFDRRVRFNTALFHTWKSNNQAIVNSFVPGIGVTQFIQNNGKARIYGIENELTVQPYRGLQIAANLSLQDGEYESGTFSETQVIAGSGCPTINGVANSCVVDLSGLPLIQLPKTQFNISARQSFEIGGGELSFQAAYAYVSQQFFNQVRAAPQQPAIVRQQYAEENALGRIPGYGLFNGRIAFVLDEPNIEIALFARNITKKRFLVRTFSDLYRSVGFAAQYAGEPRTYGVSLGYKF